MRGITQPLSWRFKFQKVMVARHLQPIGVPSEGYELQSGLAVLNGSASDQFEPFEKEAVEKADTTKIEELLGQLQ